MIEIKGKVNAAICYATVVEDEAIEQIRRMCDHDFTAGSQIRIMPDVHAGKGCTIGTTMTITDKAVPNIVGVDIGCGSILLSWVRWMLILKRSMLPLMIFPAEEMFGKGAWSVLT